MTLLGIVSDDVTGGTTVGALLARKGVSPTVFYDSESIAEVAKPDEEALIVSTDSRALTPEGGYRVVRDAAKDLIALGTTLFSKRIDTTLRGGIGHEVEGMLSALDDDYVAVIVPAMPQSKKIVIGGYSLIDSIPLSETDVAQDVRTPVLTSDVRELIQSQCKTKVAYIPIQDVFKGPRVIEAQLYLQRSRGSKIFLVDATTDEEIDWIATAITHLQWNVIAVDPGPFTVSLAIHKHVVIPKSRDEKPLRLNQKKSDKGTIIAVACSATKTTRRQIRRLSKEKGSVVVPVDTTLLISSDTKEAENESNEVLKQVEEICAKTTLPRVLILPTDIAYLDKEAASPNELEEISGLNPFDAENLMTKRFSRLAREVADLIGPERCAGFYLTGGDTMLALCRELQAYGLKITDYLIPQVDQSILVGGPYSGTPVICKGGLTGTEETAIQAVNRLFDQNHIQTNNKEKVLV